MSPISWLHKESKKYCNSLTIILITCLVLLEIVIYLRMFCFVNNTLIIGGNVEE